MLLYDGQSQFDLDGDEFVRVQRKAKDAAPAAGPAGSTRTITPASSSTRP